MATRHAGLIQEDMEYAVMNWSELADKSGIAVIFVQVQAQVEAQGVGRRSKSHNVWIFVLSKGVSKLLSAETKSADFVPAA